MQLVLLRLKCVNSGKKRKKYVIALTKEMKLKKQQQVARQAAGLYRNPYPYETSPYLERKQVPVLILRED